MISEPTKALLVVLGIIFIPAVGYFLFIYLKEKYDMNNAIHVDFKKSKGKTKGYMKDKKGEWRHDENLYLEDHDDLIDEHPECLT